MVLQRIQSVYLLIAAILMAVFAFFPALLIEQGGEQFAYGALSTTKVGFPLMMVLVVLISLLAVIDIFMYKNLQRQMTVCFVDIIISLSLILAIGIQAFVIGRKEDVTVTCQWAMALPVLSVVFLMLAHKAMSRDKKLLRDSDRLR